MGFTQAQCKTALERTNNNFERALDLLLNRGEELLGLNDLNNPIDQELLEEQRIL
jgi:uncharacterized UBP type Zn finger protein